MCRMCTQNHFFSLYMFLTENKPRPQSLRWTNDLFYYLSVLFYLLFKMLNINKGYMAVKNLEYLRPFTVLYIS